MAMENDDTIKSRDFLNSKGKINFVLSLQVHYNCLVVGTSTVQLTPADKAASLLIFLKFTQAYI
jgi:hypothetical protein